MASRKRASAKALETREYRQLAAFRHALRSFLRFSEEAARRNGLTAQRYQALLALRAAEGLQLTVNHLAGQLLIRHNSAVGLANRLGRQGLVARKPAADDRRKVYLRLTPKGDRVLERLASVHREELRRIGPQLREFLGQIGR